MAEKISAAITAVGAFVPDYILTNKELESAKNLFTKYIYQEKHFSTKTFQSDLFKMLPVKIYPWINSIFVHIQEKSELSNFDNELYFIYFIYLLTNYHTNDSDELTMYYHRNIFITLYDLCAGHAGEYDSNKKIDFKIVASLINFSYEVFHEQHKADLKSFTPVDISNFNPDDYLKQTLESYYKKPITEIKTLELEKVLKSQFYNFDSYMRLYFKSRFLGVNIENFHHSLPILEENITFPFYMYYIYCLNNANIFGRYVYYI